MNSVFRVTSTEAQKENYGLKEINLREVNGLLVYMCIKYIARKDQNSFYLSPCTLKHYNFCAQWNMNLFISICFACFIIPFRFDMQINFCTAELNKFYFFSKAGYYKNEDFYVNFKINNINYASNVWNIFDVSVFLFKFSIVMINIRNATKRGKFQS